MHLINPRKGIDVDLAKLILIVVSVAMAFGMVSGFSSSIGKILFSKYLNCESKSSNKKD